MRGCGTFTRGERNIRWIETYCLVPAGLDKGRRVRLTPTQRETVRRLYDNVKGPQLRDVPVAAPLTAYLALLHVCGPEAMQHDFWPAVDVDVFTIWGAVGPDLRAVLKRDGERITCPELGTSYSAEAAA
jgi:hypothetical protein